ncbi:hypothetical protein [Micromonospora craniellae]|uniref:Uncharacterized protein n=1 Tax=Micromonospora craniellae TaxID=2294034 RepID=A0A372FXP1_9ACTN|nr:hypothetical protein [Micromonospora craniellae]RFS45555.1 hypothetical protein D0Q02_15745 [Micromonospora craniellae]
MTDYIAADPDVLLAGGADMTDVARVILKLAEDIEWTSRAFDYSAHGEDAFTATLDRSYRPTAEACRDFVRMLSDFVNSRAEAVVGSGQILGGADNAATDVAAGRR